VQKLKKLQYNTVSTVQNPYAVITAVKIASRVRFPTCL